MASEQLLTEFNRFDDETLEKLITIGDSILSPMDGELTSADFATMVAEVFKANGLADTYFPEWKDRSKSDFGRFLIELFALFSDKDFFYINHYSREGFLKVADRYRSIFHKALHHGFNPPSNTSAEGDVELIFSSGSEEEVPRGAIVLGISNVPELVYINKEFTIPESGVDIGVSTTFMHGKLRKEQIFFDGYSIVIDTPNVVTGSVELVIDGVTWTETDNFIRSVGNKFMVFYDENGRAEIHFGKPRANSVTQTVSSAPEEGALCSVEYIVGGGYIGDIPSGTVNRVINNQTGRNITDYTQFSFSGGNDIMGKELLRETVIGKARHQNRVVTPEDAQYFCKELSFVHKVYATVFLNYCYVYVLPIGGGDITESQEDIIKEVLQPYILMGIYPTVSSAIYVPITMKINVYVSTNTVRTGAYATATQLVDEVLNPFKKGGFGEGVNRSTIASTIIQRTKGSQNVTVPILYRGVSSVSTSPTTAPSDLEFLGEEVVDVENSNIEINIIGGV